MKMLNIFTADYNLLIDRLHHQIIFRWSIMKINDSAKLVFYPVDLLGSKFWVACQKM